MTLFVNELKLNCFSAIMRSLANETSIKHLSKLLLLFVTFLVIDYHCYSSSNSKGYKVCSAYNLHRNDWKDLRLTIRERDKLHLFAERVKNKLPEYYMHTNFYLIRWLRARNLNIDNAEIMLLENIRWRHMNKISSILAEDFSDVRDEYPVSTDCRDKNDRPVGTFDFGSWNIAEAVLEGKLARLFRIIDYFQESLSGQVIEAHASRKRVTRAVVLIDMEGFSFIQHACPPCINVFIRLITGMESHYPGFWEEIVIINAPSILRVFLDGLKSVFPPQNRIPFILFDKNQKEWMQYLDDRIERDQRYENFGGTRDIKDHDRS